jgi:hypothetical protein
MSPLTQNFTKELNQTFSEEDIVTLLEVARICFAMNFATVVNRLDINGDTASDLRNRLNQFMDNQTSFNP